MKLIASMWTIPIALCLSGAAFADELTTSGDAKARDSRQRCERSQKA
jgi:uncharacterized protein YlxW (UPF0749 family)